MKMAIILPVQLFLFAFLPEHAFAQSDDLKPIVSGYSYNEKTPGIYVIKNAAEWETLWTQCLKRKEKPIDINFSDSFIIAIFRAQCPTGEYAVKIRSLKQVNNNLVVDIVYSNPGDNCRRRMDVTKPFVIYSLQKTKLVLFFRESTETTICNN